MKIIVVGGGYAGLACLIELSRRLPASERVLLDPGDPVVVGDPWHGKGIGATLLQRCLGIARERGIREVTGTVLAENTQMLALGRKLGFKIKKEPSVPEYELSIDLGQN